MTHLPRDLHVPTSQYRGFVVAMRAKLISAARPSAYEWIIVSRYGGRGEYLSVAWTGVAARAGAAPFHLRPRHTAVAVRRERHNAWAPATFRLASALPAGVPVAGHFAPAEGYVRLYGGGRRLRLVSAGQSLKPAVRGSWRMEAARMPWIGEFVEGLVPPEG